MIGKLTGTLSEKNPPQVLVDCGGVGYEVQITRRHWDGLPTDGQALTLHVHQAIREDSWTLYGFGQRHERDLFRATLGGMGLTGLVLGCVFDAIPIETDRMRVDTRRTRDLDETMAVMAEHDGRFRYTVAWMDSLADGRKLGRGVVTMGDHASRSALDAGSSREFSDRTRVTVPAIVPSGLLNRTTIGLFNELWYRKAPKQRSGELQGLGEFFHPLDMIGEWSRCYGSKGMVQYQFVVPFGEEAAMRTVIERLSASGSASFLAVLKRFGDGNPAPLSFPTPGWTLALDVPAASKGLGDLLHGLDEIAAFVTGNVEHVQPRMVGRRLPVLTAVV